MYHFSAFNRDDRSYWYILYGSFIGSDTCELEHRVLEYLIDKECLVFSVLEANIVLHACCLLLVACLMKYSTEYIKFQRT